MMFKIYAWNQQTDENTTKTIIKIEMNASDWIFEANVL